MARTSTTTNIHPPMPRPPTTKLTPRQKLDQELDRDKESRELILNASAAVTLLAGHLLDSGSWHEAEVVDALEALIEQFVGIAAGARAT